MNGTVLIKNKLSITIITYNRANLLNETLKEVLNSPFGSCDITILNNASTDNTIEICSNYIENYPNLSIVTNIFNIGGDANILRAFEYASKEYLWILADDDKYNFSYCEDVINHLLEGNIDLIHVGAHTDTEWKYGGRLSTTKELVKEGYTFFRFSSFLPCNIFKISTIKPYIIDGYKNINNLYPHMPYLLSYYLLNKKIYIAKNRIVNAVIGFQNYKFNFWLNGWVNTSYILNNKKDIHTCIFEQFHTTNSVKVLWSIIYNRKYYHLNNKCIYKMIMSMNFRQHIVLCLGILPYYLYKKTHSLINRTKFLDKLINS